MQREVLETTKSRVFKSEFFFKDFFFHAVITERNNLDIRIRNSSSFIVFMKELLKSTRAEPNLTYNILHAEKFKLLTR